MATTKTINDYSAAGSIDATNDYLLIEQSGVYKKINRNTIMGVTGTPMDTSTAQSVSHKNFTNSNSMAIKDTSLTLENGADTTKQAVFDLSGITTSTVRAITLPNYDATMATLAGTETLTNKTLTAPAISGGTIDGSTITVDSISGHTSPTIVTVANLQISNGVLNSANAVTSTSIAAGAIQPQALVSGTGAGWSWQSWSPSYTNVTIGNGTVDAHYVQIGKTVIGRWFFTMGSTSAMGTAPMISFPVAPLAAYYTTFGTSAVIGMARIISGGNPFIGHIWAKSASNMEPVAQGAAATYVTEVEITAAIPGAWTTGDKLFLEFFYETA